MRENQGKKVQLLDAVSSAPAAPSGDVGQVVLASSLFVTRKDGSGNGAPAKWLVTVRVGGTGAAVIKLYARDWADVDSAGDWGFLGDNQGKLNLGSSISTGETYHFLLTDLGVFHSLYATFVISSGAPLVSVWVSEVLEATTSRGD